MTMDYVLHTIQALHPGSSVSVAHGRRDGVRYVLVPSANRPALVVPAGDPRRAAAACRSYSEAVGRRARLRSTLLAAAFRTRLAGVLFRDQIVVGPSSQPALDATLGQLLSAEVQLAFAVGKTRANRKPVLLTVDETGRVLAYVKLGVGPLSDRLVAHEAESLGELAVRELGIVQVPAVVHAGTWGGHPLLVSASLPVEMPRGEDIEPKLRRAMTDVARSGGVSHVAVCSSPWWGRLSSSVSALPGSAEATRVADAARRIESCSLPEIPVGTWHGDWNRGNAAVLEDRVLVWDWERFASGVPLGWDALHRSLWQIVPRGGTPDTDELRRLLDGAPTIFAPFSVDPDVAPLIATLYLLELAVRFVADDQQALGVAMGAVDTWLLPVLDERVRALLESSGVATMHVEELRGP